MSADRFRLAVFILIVVVLAAAVWAGQWRYVTSERGALLRFNRFTGAQEIYACHGYATGYFYSRVNDDCDWVRR